MTYQVHWRKGPLDDLASIWLGANPEKRRAITRGVDAIDRSLRLNPQNVGESRSSDFRIAFCPPLAIKFQVDIAQAIVYVVHVWRIR